MAAASISGGPGAVAPWLQPSAQVARLKVEADEFCTDAALQDRMCITQSICALYVFRKIPVDTLDDRIDEVDADAPRRADADTLAVAKYIARAVHAIVARTDAHDYSNLVSTDNFLYGATLFEFMAASVVVHTKLVVRQHFFPVFPEHAAKHAELVAAMHVTPAMLEAAEEFVMEAFVRKLAAFVRDDTGAFGALNTGLCDVAAMWFPLKCTADAYVKKFDTVMKMAYTALNEEPKVARGVARELPPAQ